MKAYKCPVCGVLDPILFSEQSFFCFAENCDWAFTDHDHHKEVVEIVEIIDWDELLTKT